MKRKINYLIVTIFSFIFLNGIVKAGTLDIYASSTSVTVGSNVIITIKAPDVAGNFSVSSSNGYILSGGSSSTWIEGTVTYTFNANNPGSATVTVRPIDAADYSGNVFSSSKSITINVNPKKVVVLSSDNTLSNLSIEGKDISPEFNSDTLEYTIELEPETTKININAEASHGGAYIEGAGEREVSDGDNNLEIKVTAENGDSRTYVIKATVKEYNPIKVKIDNEEYTVIRKKSQLKGPDNYEETTVKINNEDIPAYKSKVTKYTLVGLKDKDGKANFYIYKDNKYTLYQEFKFNGVVVSPVEIKNNIIPSGYKKVKIKYNDKDIEAYKTKASSKYALIYGMNVETGETHLYMYDSKEDTIQIFNKEYSDIQKQTDLYLKILIATSTLSVVLIGIIIFILIKNKKKIKSVKVD